MQSGLKKFRRNNFFKETDAVLEENHQVSICMNTGGTAGQQWVTACCT
jgi:hypothetical protein